MAVADVLYWWRVLYDEELLHFMLAVLPEETQVSSDDTIPPVVSEGNPASHEKKRKKCDDDKNLEQYRINMQRNTEAKGKSLESSAKSMQLSAFVALQKEVHALKTKQFELKKQLIYEKETIETEMKEFIEDEIAQLEHMINEAEMKLM